MNIIRPESSGHWYSVEGKACHTVIGSNGAERDTTLRDARKLGLLPSATSILKVRPKDNLESWKQEQIALAVATLPRLENEPLDAFINRAIEDSKKQMRAAAEFGTAFHKLAEGFHIAGMPEFICVRGQARPALRHYADWARANIAETIFTEHVLVNPNLGYAGTCDLQVKLKDGRVALCDYKTTKVKDGKPTFWDTWSMQLAAYSQCTEVPSDVLISIVVNSEKPEAPYIKEWTQEEAEHGWEAFKDCLRLWCRVKKYWPAKAKELTEAV